MLAPSCLHILFTAARQRLTLIVLSVCLSVCLSLAACARSPAAPPSQLLLYYLSDPKSFNCGIPNDLDTQKLCGNLYEGLVTVNGVTLEIEPALAETWQVRNNGQQIVFQLRQGLVWSDGQPLNADDVLFTFRDVLFNEKIPAPYRDSLRIGEAGVFPKVRKLDDLRVAFDLPEPFAPFLSSVGVPILPRHALEQTLSADTANGPPRFLNTWGIDTDVTQIVSSGAYQLAEYRPAERITLVRNPNYRKRGKPYIGRVILNIVDSTDTSLLQFRSRDLDVLAPLQPEFFQLLKREEQRDGFKIYNAGPDSSSVFLAFNQNRGRSAKTNQPFVNPIRSAWFNDLAFRRAVTYAINRPAMINNVYRGLGSLQHSQESEQSPFYLSPQQGLRTYDYDLDQAKALLQTAGYTFNAQGQLQDAKGNAIRFTLITNAGNKTREAIGDQIQNDLAQLGIQVDFVPIDWNRLIGKLDNSRDWEAVVMGLGGGGIEPNSGANIWRSDGSLHLFNQGSLPGQPPQTGRVVTDWEQRLDQLFITGARELDPAKRQAIYAEYQRIVQDQLPFSFLVRRFLLGAVRNRVEAVHPSVITGFLWNLEDLRLREP